MKYQGSRILIGVTGGIAAYKACEFVRHFVKNGAEVRVVMTAGAAQFVTPLTFETLSGHPVTTQVFPAHDPDNQDMSGTHHIQLARWPDVFLIVPTTANVAAKIAHGIADDALTTVALASTSTLLLAMAMNDQMWNNPATLANMEILKTRGIHIIEPETGFLAEGYDGKGRLAELDTIVKKTESLLGRPGLLDTKKILITAGPTQEALDPVRYLTNHSSGKMGYALARQAWKMGAEVTLISGPTSLQSPVGIRTIRIVSAKDMAEQVRTEFASHDALVMCAAVADFRPAHIQSSKIKKDQRTLSIDLEPTEDILAGLGRQKHSRRLIGFALETDNAVEHGRRKLAEKNLDFIVINSPSPESGFNSDTNRVILLDAVDSEELPVMTKDEVAVRILEKLAKLFN